MLLLDHVDEFCDSCVLGKQRRLSFPQVANYCNSNPLDQFHTDLCGQIRPATLGGKSYYKDRWTKRGGVN
jgi:hypothetical protein